VQLSAAEEVELRFRLPDTGDLIHATGTVVWTTVSQCGIRFSYIPESERLLLEQWITECVERSLTELCDRIRMACA
jgi:hypothetical protein